MQCPTGRVYQYRVGSGRVLDKIPGSGSGSGRVGVSKYTIGYFRLSFLLSGISVYLFYSRVFPVIFFTLGYFRVCRVFSGISGYVGYFRVCTGILDIILGDTQNFGFPFTLYIG